MNPTNDENGSQILKLSTKLVKSRMKTLGFFNTKDDSQNTRWGYAPKKIIEEKTQYFSSTHDNLSFLLFIVFCIHLFVYLGAYLCYGMYLIRT